MLNVVSTALNLMTNKRTSDDYLCISCHIVSCELELLVDRYCHRISKKTFLY